MSAISLCRANMTFIKLIFLWNKLHYTPAPFQTMDWGAAHLEVRSATQLLPRPRQCKRWQLPACLQALLNPP